MLHDRARIHVEGGGGGNGAGSFRREAHVPRGGPDGGDGGRGGDVVLVCDPSRRDLAALRHSRHYRAGRGGNGEGSQRHGAQGDDVEIPVPPGTQVTGLDAAVADIVAPGTRVVAARGGVGGRGNKRFATSTRQAPRFAERGLPGESGWIELRLKLLADVGLVGRPNAGKSSLLARITRAAPKVAAYPFTTVEPVLGTLDLDDRQVVLADIPGLIEGAAEGAGLGHEFLAHVERCRVLVHLVEIAPEDGADPREAYAEVRAELASHGHGLDALPEVVVLSKSDLVPAEEGEETVRAWRAELGDRAVAVLTISSATGAGLDELRAAAVAAHDARAEAMPGEPTPPGEFEVEHRVYTPGAEAGFAVEPIEQGVWRVEGPGVERLMARHDLTNEESLAYIEERLHAMGVVRELRQAGFQPGHELQIGESTFHFYPDR